MYKHESVDNRAIISKFLKKFLLSLMLTFFFFGLSFSGIGLGHLQEADASVMLAPPIPKSDVGYKADYYVRNLVVDYRGGDIWPC